MEIGNCSRCGRIYHTNPRKLCPECLREEEEQFERVVKYLRDNEGVSAQVLSEALEIPLEQVTHFLKEGRLVEVAGLEYPCASCGKPIKTGRICDTCRLSRELSARQMATDLHREVDAKRQSGHIGYLSRVRDGENK